jgi:hypothetical protein
MQTHEHLDVIERAIAALFVSVFVFEGRAPYIMQTHEQLDVSFAP